MRALTKIILIILVVSPVILPQNVLYVPSKYPAIQDAGDPNSQNDPDGTRTDIGAFYFDQLINTIEINVTSPVEGTTWIGGSNEIVTWEPPIVFGNMNIWLSTDGGSTFPTALSLNTLNDGIDTVTVPYVQSGQFRIKVISIEDTSVYGLNPGLFSIIEQFTEQTTIGIINVSESDVAWGDYDNDGDLDFIIAGNDNGTSVSRIYRNNGDNTFTEQQFIELTGVRLGSVAWGDYDNDGDLDLLLTGGSNSEGFISKIYRNIGNNQFSEEITILPTGNTADASVWGDYDNDGDLDILILGSGDSYIYRNDNNNLFTRLITLSGANVGSGAWGDYDNDGDLDIIISGRSPGYMTKIYRNEGDDNFEEQVSISLTGVSQSSVTWGDYDNDGDLDILLSGEASSISGRSIVYRNEGNNSFTEQTQMLLEGVYQSSVVWGDYDNDGDLDILLSGYNPQNSNSVSKIYRNDGNNLFVEIPEILLTGVYTGSVAWGDYDNDGDLDILLTGDDGSNPVSKIYRNNNTASNISPNAPSNLNTTTNDNVVTLSWDKSTDNETPQDGLKYNLVIGTNPNAVDILSPMSDRLIGYRKVISLGNTNHNNRWSLKDLGEGTYYWSVQAIDNAFAGSAFANQDTFFVSVIPVELTLFNAKYIEPNVVLNWQTATEVNSMGFEIQRKIRQHENEGRWEMIGFIKGAGTTTEPQKYSFIDDISMIEATLVKYRLKQIDFDGEYEYSETVEVEISIPIKYVLNQNYPNPFNPSTTIKYSIPKESLITLKIYNTLGQEVVELINENKPAGRYEIEFIAENFSSGIYIYQIKAGDFVETKKMVLMK